MNVIGFKIVHEITKKIGLEIFFVVIIDSDESIKGRTEI